MERHLAIAVAVMLIAAGCDSGKPVDEIAREVLSVRLIGFIIVLAIAFFFVIRNLRRK